MGSLYQQGFSEAECLRPDLCGPAFEPLRCPLQIFLVLDRHVFLDRGMAAPLFISYMAGHPFAVVETFNCVLAVTDIELFFNQGVGDGVIVALHLYI